MVVTFASPFNESSLVPHVAYGTQSQRYTTVAFGESTHLGDEWNEKGLQWIHSVTLEVDLPSSLPHPSPRCLRT